MYTRCPSCRSEISFEPPANMENLPDGYKHKIKCPCCGVTIGVHLDKPVADVQPTFTPQNPYATNPEPVLNAGQAEPESKSEAKARKNANKKSGIGRNLVLFIISALFIAINIVAYVFKGYLEIESLNQQYILTNYNGIQIAIDLFSNFNSFIDGFSDNLLGSIKLLLPIVILLFSVVTFLTSFISMCGKKYSRAFNFIWSLLTFALTLVLFFFPLIDKSMSVEQFFVPEIYYDLRVETLAGACLGFLQFLFSLIFCSSMKKKSKTK